MKLHLPKPLRNSVLACIAAVAGIATPTLGTATFAGGVVAFTLASQQAMAETYEITTDGDGHLTSATADDKLILNLTGWLTPNGTLTINAPVEIVKGEITDGSSNRTYTFNGAITGSGIFSCCPPDGSGANNQTYVFQGDMSAYSGDMSIVAAKTGVFTFNGKTGTGAVSAMNASSVVNLGNNAVVNNSAISATNINIGTGVTVQSTLTLGGTINLSGTITNTGSITFAEGTVLNLANIAETDGKYVIITGGTVDMSALTAESITGVRTYGREWSFNSDGTISYVLTADSIIWNGGAVSLEEGATVGEYVFNDGDFLTFSTGDAEVTLAGNVSSGYVQVDDGVEVAFAGGDNRITVTDLLLNGTVVLKDGCLTATTITKGNNGKFALDLGNEVTVNLDDLPITAENQCTVPIEVRSGSLRFTAGRHTYGDVAVKNGAGLLVDGPSTVGTVKIEGNGGWLWNNEAVNAALYTTVGSSLNGALVLTGDATVGAANGKKLTLQGPISGDYVLSTTGAGTVEIGTGQYNVIRITDTTLKVNAGTVLQFHCEASDVSTASVELAGGELKMHDMGSSTDSLKFGKLNVTANSRINFQFNGAFMFNEVTGSGNLELDGGNDGLGDSVYLKSLSDYTGAISRWDDMDTLKIDSVNTTEGKITTINTDFLSSNFQKTGEGELKLNGNVTIDGTCVVNYEGIVTMGEGKSFIIAEGALLSYTGDNSHVLTLGTLENNVAIDLFAVSADILREGINLGIAANTDPEIAALKEKLNVVGIDSYTLTSKDGLAWLSSDSAATTPWDKNWGFSVISSAPATTTTVAIASDADNVSLAASAANTDGKVAANLTGGNDGACIYGGIIDSTHTGSTWITAKEGNYKLITGGNYANNWGGGTRADFIGDSHIIVDGATVGTIIGGNCKDGQGASFTGNSYISVISGDVTAAIIGAGTNSHLNTNTFNGNTNIFVYVPLDTNNVNNLPGGSAGDSVIGAGMRIDNNSGTNVVNGSTNITVDLSNYTGEKTNFAKRILGGHFNWASSMTANINGDTNVTIVGKEGITFTNDIVGGSRVNAGSINTTGTSSIAISGGSVYSGMIVGASYLEGNITSNAGKTSISLGAGTYNGQIVGGSYNNNVGTSNTGDISLSIGGTVNQNVVGGSYVQTGAATANTGNISVAVAEGGSTTWNLIGGTYVNGTGNATVTVSTGDITVVLNGGTTKDIIGGSYVLRNNADATVSQQNVTVKLMSGVLAGDVYAGGYQGGSTKLQSVSTQVVLSSDVTTALHGEDTDGVQIISGGYKYADGQSGSTVTGGSTLVLSGSQDRSGLSFADFNGITVEGTDKATIGGLTSTTSVTKQGGGTLALGGGTYNLAGGMKVEAGSLAVSGDITLGGALTLAAGAGLDVSAGTLTLNGALTMGSGLVLSVGEMGLGDNVIISGVTSVTGLTEEVSAATFFSSITGVTNIDDYKVKFEGNSLILVNASSKELSWDAQYDTWAIGQAFATVDGAAVSFANNDIATFGTLAEDEAVTIHSDGVAAMSVTIDAGEGKTYSFSGGSLNTATLHVDSGTAVFGNNTLNLNNLQSITVNGTLDLTAYGTNTPFSTIVARPQGTGLLKLGGHGSDPDAYRVDLKHFDGYKLTAGVNYEITGHFAIDGEGHEGATFLLEGKSMTLSSGKVLRVQNNATLEIGNGGSFTGIIQLGLDSGGDATTRGHVLITDGAVVSLGEIKRHFHNATSDAADTLTMTGGTLELTSATTIQNIATTITGGILVADTASWGINGTTIGGATVAENGALNCAVQIRTTGDNTITLTNATLLGTLNNADGNLVVGGTVDITSDGYESVTTPREFSNSGNGYTKTNATYSLVTTTGNLSVAENTQWTVDGSSENVSYADGVVTVAGTDWGTEYYICTGDATLSSIGRTNAEGEELTTIVLAGSGLNMNQDLGNVTIRVEKEGQSVVAIGSTQTLAAGQVAGTDARHQLKLHGSGTYALASGTAALGDGTVLGDEWTGTVKVTDATGLTDFNVDSLGGASSSVELTGVSGYLMSTKDSDVIYNTNLKLVDDGEKAALKITNGWRNGVNTFAGSVSGSGSMVIASGVPSGISFGFTGDLSNWQGAFVENSGTTVNLNIASTGNVGADIIRQQGTLNITFSGNGTVLKGDIGGAAATSTAKTTITVAEGSSVTMEGSVLTSTLTNNGTLDVIGTLDAGAAVTNNGTLTVTGTLDAGAAVTNNGTLTVSGTLDASAAVTNNGTLDVTGTLADGAAVINNATLTLTQDTATLASLAGTGSVTAQNLTLTGAATDGNSITSTSLTLQAATNTVGALELGTLTLGEAVTSLTAGELNISGDVVVSKVVANFLTSTGLATDSKLNLNIDEALLQDYMAATNTTSVELATVTGLTLDLVTLNKDTTGWSGTDHTLTTSDDQYTYALDVTTEGVLTLTRSTNGIVWNGEAGEKWVMDTTTESWLTKGDNPDELTYGTVAQSTIFNGSGEKDVVISGEVASTNVTFDVTGADIDGYTFKAETGTDDRLIIEKNLSINGGELKLEVNTQVGGRTEVGATGKLTLATPQNSIMAIGAGLSNRGELNVAEGAMVMVGDAITASESVAIINAGTMTNAGQLLVSGVLTNTNTLTNSGQLMVGLDATNTGTIQSTAGQFGVTGNLTNGAAGEDAAEAALTISGGQLTIGGLLENNASGTVTITGEDTTVAVGNGDIAVAVANAGTISINGAGATITGAVSNSGEMTVGCDAMITGAVSNSGEMTLSGDSTTIGGDVTNTNSMAVSGSTLIYGDVENTSEMTLSGATTIEGNVTNTSGEMTLSGETTTIGGYVENTGTLTVSGTTEITGNVGNTGTLTLSGDTTAISGGVGNTGTLTLNSDTTVTGDVVNSGRMDIAGSDVTVGGHLNNTDGTITIGSDEATGSLSVGGNLLHAGQGDIVVNSDSSLDVTGDLSANGMTLGFDGNVTVGGEAIVDDLTINEGASFSANEANIGTLVNDGTLSVGAMDNDVLTGGSLHIGSLTGTGSVNVGEGGQLFIEDDTTFAGSVDNKGTVSTDSSVTLRSQTENGGNIVAGGIVIESDANGSVFGAVQTDSITIQTLETDGGVHLAAASLTGKSGAAVEIALTELTTEAGVDKLIQAGVKDYHLLSIGGVAPELTMAELAYDRAQQLWQSGLKISGLESTSTMALRSATTNVGISVLEQTEEESTWYVGDTTTGIGLTVLTDDGKLVSDKVLDNVRNVVVSGSKTIDLEGSVSTVKLNKLIADASKAANALRIEGDGADEDSVSIGKSRFDGSLVLESVAAEFDLTGTHVTAVDDETTMGGKLDKGMLTVAQEDTAQGTGLSLTDTTVQIVIEDDTIVLQNGNLKDLEKSIVDLGDVSADSSCTIKMGTIDEETGEFIDSEAYDKYFNMGSARIEGGHVVADRNTVYYTSKLTDTASSDNGKAGLAMADEALLSANPQGATSTGDLAAVLDQLDEYVAKGNKAAADELGASLAGASTAVLGMAAMGDVDRQLRAIRNRTTTMGVDQSVVNADMPYVNAWINAEGDSREVGESGTLGGYRLNSYGGTVGFDVDIEPTFTAGMALTAMYGDLDAKGADKASGNLDSYYVSAFARYCGSAWTHTFVGTIGTGDISLDRTVLGHKVQGETDAMSFGLMYEVGRVYALDEDGTACLQPVFNVTWKHSSVDAYTEKGGDIALKVDEQTLNTITFGLGARLQAVVGESMYNRTSIFECRLLAKADAGDREGSTKVALADSASHEVKSNEMGAIGIEIGAGLTIPLGDEGSSIFMDASAEIRSDYTDVNGTVGYRVNF